MTVVMVTVVMVIVARVIVVRVIALRVMALLHGVLPGTGSIFPPMSKAWTAQGDVHVFQEE